MHERPTRDYDELIKTLQTLSEKGRWIYRGQTFKMGTGDDTRALL